MKKRTLFWGIILFLIFILVLFRIGVSWRTKADTKEEKKILSLVKSSAVYGDLTEQTNLYEQADKNSKVLEELKKGAQVEILEDRSTKWYLVLDNITGTQGWIAGNTLEIPEDSPTENSEITEKQKETYIKILELNSETDYLVWVDINRQMVNIFEKKEDVWEFLQSFICATGKNVSPTVRGTFQISERGEWFFSERLGSGAKYWVRFHDTYLFHSVAMDENKEIIDGVLGERRSGGCVRMSVADAKWFFDMIPEKTTVFIN